MIWIVTSVLIIIIGVSAFYIGRLFPYQERIDKEIYIQLEKKDLIIKSLTMDMQRMKVRYDFIMNRLTERANDKNRTGRF